MNYSTSGATWKLKHCLDQTLKQMNFDPELAHDFTILATPDNTNRKRVLISIELRSRND